MNINKGVKRLNNAVAVDELITAECGAVFRFVVLAQRVQVGCGLSPIC